MRGRAFTLYELLAVLAIISLLMGMILVIPRESDRHRVEKAARELQAVLIQARSLAMRSGETHAVAFHLENAGDGHVLKNHPQDGRANRNAATGGHWYAIIGPDKSGDTNNPASIPMLDRDFNDTNRAKKYRCVVDFVAGMQLAQVGQRHVLPEGVRFLALSDGDHGSRFINENVGQSHNGATYPRPWFGHFDPVAGRLYTWGGYDPDIDHAVQSTHPAIRGYPVTGLGYQGADVDAADPAARIPYDFAQDTLVNPAQVYGRIEHFDQPRHPGETGTPCAALEGRPRPLLDAYWGDAMLVFAPDGHAFWVDSYLKRRLFERGGQSRFITWRGTADLRFVAATGGFHITLARDPDGRDEIYPVDDATTGQPAWNRFDRVEDALASITPFVRVFVAGRTGEVLLKPQGHPDCRITARDLLGHDPYPQP